MGMDVTGRYPSDTLIGYFQAGVWSRRPIHDPCTVLCSNLVDEELLTRMTGGCET